MRELLPPLKSDQAIQIMTAVLNSPRQNIMSIIQSNNNEIEVGKIVKKVPLTQSRVSFHLKILRQAGLVIARKDGKKVYYSLDHQAIERLNAICKKLY